MRLIFIDETSDNKFKNYFGLSVATIDHTKYAKVKAEFQKILRKSNWNEDIEFKGSCLFSAKSGDSNVTIEERIEIATGLIELTASKANARMDFHYLRAESEPKEHGRDYLRLVPALLAKAVKKAPTGAGKNIAFISFDQRSDTRVSDLSSAIVPVLQQKGYVVLEEPTMMVSNFHTVGILYADIIGYLAARIDNISNDSELFEGISPEQFETNGKIRKLRSSEALIAKVKNIQNYEISVK